MQIFSCFDKLTGPPNHLTPVKKRGGAKAGRIPNWRPKSALLDLVPNQFACLFKGCEINVAIHETLECVWPIRKQIREHQRFGLREFCLQWRDRIRLI
jgi:hypothetical protein